MLFDKDHPKICAFCFHGQDYGPDAILCSKKGPVGLQDHCSKFVYGENLRPALFFAW